MVAVPPIIAGTPPSALNHFIVYTPGQTVSLIWLVEDGQMCVIDGPAGKYSPIVVRSSSTGLPGGYAYAYYDDKTVEDNYYVGGVATNQVDMGSTVQTRASLNDMLANQYVVV